MDQLKPALAWLGKYHFWVLSGLAVIVALVAWFVAASDLQARYDSRKQKLDSDFQQMQQIQGEPEFPNQKVIQQVQDRHEQLKKKVFEAWKTLYEQQQSKNPWPDVLGKEFKDFITSQSHDAEIPNHFREIYLNFIAQYIPKLLAKIDIRLPKAGAAKPAAAAPLDPSHSESEAKPTEYTGLVFWDEGNLKSIQDRFKWGSVPSTLEVRLAQEDLWVYEALLRIIKNTNEGAREHFKAPVRRIEALEIGQAATAALSKAGGATMSFAEESPEGAESEEGGAGPEEGGGGPEGGPPPDTGEPPPDGGEPDAAAPAIDAAGRMLLDRRYVDSKGQPLLAGVRHPNSEYKMMPVRLRLLMNQMQVPKLLAQCASSDMPVEVRQVRFRPEDSGRAPAGGADEPGAPEGPPAGGDLGGGGSGLSSGLGGGHEELVHSLYIPVEILGIIYIYNPPDEAKLRSGPKPEGADEGAPAPAEPGAAPAEPAEAPAEPEAAPAEPMPAAAEGNPAEPAAPGAGGP